MAAGEQTARRRATRTRRETDGTADGLPAPVAAPANPTPRRHSRRTTLQPRVETLPGESMKRRTAASTPRRTRAAIIAQVDRPAVASCADLDALRALDGEAARAHVDAYLRGVMAADEADGFEVLHYRWELHLVEIEQLVGLRSVDLSRGTLRRYRAALKRGDAFPPLIGLGGEGKDPTAGVLLCDGYHRAVAMRDVGLHFAWMWLAVGVWERAETGLALVGERRP
jgi:hypothetical protein